mmetsp:Transcript_14607/g.31782  ORF Transcript_14607/g.31782 Transcript_14607/m.31782 type:complete len:272 (-) Transcript_14607:230-1045(-)|eukprot:CAMPEP_0172322536 /NCGR_PEP_ID=MMETSP1058-20130122/46179_1 /TAXON_ID=83371 /ORGANISM="Detonula confervacea, Strain CCMP 353" /LENGTH=271 /DNA_ID=CAMNT_0013038303 /DNA_START=77 /DNA_END=892 /DNA_ORIENTATION=+
MVPNRFVSPMCAFFMSIGASVHNLCRARHSLATPSYHLSSHHLRKITPVANSKTFQKPTFGIVAALAKDGVIGINGRLPWNVPIPQDRDHFVNLTRNKILIVGRKTFAEEDPTGAHINHVRVCIVVSKTMTAKDLVDRNNGRSVGEGDGSSGPEVKFARSFDEALDLASHEISSGYEKIGDVRRDELLLDEKGLIQCWVAGGERIYQEALQHNNASDVHLTHVDMTVDQTTINSISHFPLEYLERHGFEEVSRIDSGICAFCVYKRQPRHK